VGTDTTDRITSAPVRSSLVRGWFARGRAGAWRVSLNHAPSFSRQQPRVSWRQFFLPPPPPFSSFYLPVAGRPVPG